MATMLPNAGTIATTAKWAGIAKATQAKPRATATSTGLRRPAFR